MEDETETVTPGPWSVVTDGDESYSIHNLEIDEVVVWEMGGIDNKANATLMAAAPDLLAALETFCAAYSSGAPVEHVWEHDIAQLRAALAKARGDTT